MPFTSESAKKYGQKGGQSNIAKHGKERMRQIGYVGGKSLAAQRGPEFYSANGKKGIAAREAKKRADMTHTTMETLEFLDKLIDEAKEGNEASKS